MKGAHRLFRRGVCAVVVALCTVALSTPSPALAKGKIVTAIRGLREAYAIHGAGGSVRVTGRLVAVKRVRRDGRWVNVDVPMSGPVYLRYLGEGSLDDSPLPVITAIRTRAKHGVFGFTLCKARDYIVVHPSSRSAKYSECWIRTMLDVLSIKSLRVLAASREPSGSVAVTIGVRVAGFKYVNFDGFYNDDPAGFALLHVVDRVRSTPLGPIDWSSSDWFSPLTAASSDDLLPNDVYPTFAARQPDWPEGWYIDNDVNGDELGTYSFTVPGDQRFDELSVTYDFVPNDQYVCDASKTLTFTPNPAVSH